MSSFSNYYIKLNMNSEHGNGGDDELSVKVPVDQKKLEEFKKAVAKYLGDK